VRQVQRAIPWGALKEHTLPIVALRQASVDSSGGRGASPARSAPGLRQGNSGSAIAGAVSSLAVGGGADEVG